MSYRSLRLEGLEPRRLLSLSVPALQSLPTAPATLYLDFDGHYETIWGGFQSVTTPAYDRDGAPTDFSPAERDYIREIWSRVAEDYSPFNINVTTIDPGNWATADRESLRVAIGGSADDWFLQDSSGAAYLGAFTNGLPNTVYVFEDDLLDGRPSMVADIASHESAHAFGLRHQSQYDEQGAELAEYYQGTPPDWGPLMGNSLWSARSTWYNGTTTSSTTHQLDIDVIAGASNGFGYRSDDHSASRSSATALVDGGGALRGDGVIEYYTDVDFFRFTTAGGTATIDIDVARHGPNLNVRAELRAANGVLIRAAAPTGELGASFSENLAAGTYYVAVTGAGFYGDTGQYSVEVEVESAAAAPIATITGPDELAVGQPGTFRLEAVDAGGTALPGNYTFQLDYDGDGQVDDTVVGPSGTTISHAFGAVATNHVTVSAVDASGSVSAPAATSVVTVRYSLQADESDPVLTNLVVGLSDGVDITSVFAFGRFVGAYTMLLDGQTVQDVAICSKEQVNGRVVVFAGGGDDVVQTYFGQSVALFGGAGNDILMGNSGSDYLEGGPGDDLLDGGGGDDLLVAGSGRDVLIGGAGVDILRGGNDSDLLVAGRLAFDSTGSGLMAIWQQWRSGNSYLSQVANVAAGPVPGTTASADRVIVPGTTALDDGVVDLLLGEGDDDLFVADLSLDLTPDLQPGEAQVTL